MTNQEAIAIIEEHRPKKCKMVNGRLKGGFLDHDSETGRALDIVIEALEKQIPKKPTNNSWTHYHCPVCMKSVNSNYCRNCGQAIDWSEIK